MRPLTQDVLDTMTPAEFEDYLPELFEAGNGNITEDPRFAKFLAANPDCAALVKDLETIAAHAKSLFEPVDEPSDKVWTGIIDKLKSSDGPEEEPELA
jgi:hypothetical protein